MLSAVQQQVVQALAEGLSVTAAAAAAQVHRTTVYNWYAQPEFVNAVEVAREEYAAALRDELQDLNRLALKTVRELLENPKTSPGTKAKLALAVLQRPPLSAPRSWNLPLPAAELVSMPADHSTKFDRISRPPAGPQDLSPRNGIQHPAARPAANPAP